MAIAIQTNHCISNILILNAGMCVRTVLFILLEVSHFPLHASKIFTGSNTYTRERARKLEGGDLVEVEEETEGDIQVS